MVVFDTFTRRRKGAMEGGPEAYRYDELPIALRNQILHIWNAALGIYRVPSRYGGGSLPASNEVWRLIENTAARELGLMQLGSGPSHDPKQRCITHLSSCSTDAALDLIEVSFRIIDSRLLRSLDAIQQEGAGITQSPDAAIEELNQRFQQHAIGYRFEGVLIRIDSEEIHAEVVKPALHALADNRFAGASAEYYRAHDHYRSSRYEETLVECLKAFESTMKVICEERRWTYSTEATAKNLIAIIFENGLIPVYLRGEFSALRSALESGVPAIRNKEGGHGRGTEIRSVPAYLAAYCLHLTAANILLLSEAHKAKT